MYVTCFQVYTHLYEPQISLYVTCTHVMSRLDLEECNRHIIEFGWGCFSHYYWILCKVGRVGEG